MTFVRLWLVDLRDGGLDHVLLAHEEELRASRLKNGAVRWMRSRRALRHILATELGATPDEVLFSIDAKGKPRTHGLEFSLSHSGDYALIGVADTPVGVDIERIREAVDYARIAPRFLNCSPRSSREFFEIWTLREAYVKATGEGISGNLNQPPPPEHVSNLIPAPEGYAAAVAVLSPGFDYSFQHL